MRQLLLQLLVFRKEGFILENIVVKLLHLSCQTAHTAADGGQNALHHCVGELYAGQIAHNSQNNCQKHGQDQYEPDASGE